MDSNFVRVLWAHNHITIKIQVSAAFNNEPKDPVCEPGFSEASGGHVLTHSEQTELTAGCERGRPGWPPCTGLILQTPGPASAPGHQELFLKHSKLDLSHRSAQNTLIDTHSSDIDIDTSNIKAFILFFISLRVWLFIYCNHIITRQHASEQSVCPSFLIRTCIYVD